MRMMTKWLPVLLLLPLTGCGGGGSASLDADLKFLPSDCQAIGTAKVSDILASQAYKDLVAELAKMGPKSDPAEEFKTQMGIPLTDISAVTFGVSGSSKFAMVLKTSKAVAAADMIKNMKPRTTFRAVGGAIGPDGKFAPAPPPKEEPRKFKEVKLGNYTLHEEEAPFSPMAFCVVNPNTVVLSEPDTLKAILGREQKLKDYPNLKPADVSEGLKKALAQGDKSRTVFVAIDAQAAMKNVPPSRPGEPNPIAGLQGAASDVEGAVVEATIGKDTELSILVLCKSGDTATKLKTEVEGLVQLGKLFAGQATKELGPMAKDVNQVLDTIKVNASGSKVTVSAKGNVAVVMLGAIQFMGQQATHTFEKVGKEIRVVDPPPPPK